MGKDREQANDAGPGHHVPPARQLFAGLPSRAGLVGEVAERGQSHDTPSSLDHRQGSIVGMGGSAGGLEAFEQFFTHLPSDTGLVFVLVPHLEPTHKGMMPELLGRHTQMKVVEAEDGMEVQPNHVYVIPPNADLSILHGVLHLAGHDHERDRHGDDEFHAELAMDHQLLARRYERAEWFHRYEQRVVRDRRRCYKYGDPDRPLSFRQLDRHGVFDE